MHITFPSNTRQTIENIINTIGREVTFVNVTKSGCPTCGLDPKTDTSTDSFCPTCSGEYWILTEVPSGIVGHVTWKFSEQENWVTGGMTFVGDGKVKVMYSGPYLEWIEASDHIIVDGRVSDIEKVTILGVPSPNRIVLDFKERYKKDDTG
jgi:hypothetical protein